MHDVGQRSPIANPPGDRREVGERATAPHSTARSLHQTWAEFCSSYEPGPYGREATSRSIRFAVNEIRLLLIAAHLRLDSIDDRSEMPHPRVRRPEETSAGSCYGNAA